MISLYIVGDAEAPTSGILTDWRQLIKAKEYNELYELKPSKTLLFIRIAGSLYIEYLSQHDKYLLTCGQLCAMLFPERSSKGQGG